ncbi:MAG: MarR family transcriptional regulator [Ligilactobacillus ruminis]|nr:MarR family transcriptional regulator [Ligilactobacillus ruminis]
MLKHKPSHLEDELCFAVYSTQKLYNRFYSIVLKRYGLTYVQYATMLVLWEEWRPMMVKELGERLKLDPGTLTSLLNRLEKQGWVVRNRNFEDGRCMMVELMPKALSL